MKILILEDEQRNAMRLIRLLNDIDATFVIEGPFTSIKEAVEFFQSRKTTDLILADIRLNPEKRNVPLYKNDAFQKVQKRRVPEKR